MTFTTQMIKYLAISLILVGCTAPVTDPPAHAFEVVVEEQHWDHVYRAIEYIKAGQREKKMTDPSDAINSALAEFNNGSNGTSKAEELLQLPSNGDQ